MKSIGIVNTALPTVESSIGYHSGESLRDFDIVLFDPKFPYLSRIEFTGGGSCISIEGAEAIRAAMHHWKEELHRALEVGKTIFFVLNEFESDLAAIGSSYTKSQRTYSTSRINNYEILPFSFGVKNSKGKHIVVCDGVYRGLFEAIKGISQYKIVVDAGIGKKIFAAKDGAVVGAALQFKGMPGNVVFLPHFDFREYDQESEKEWSANAIKISKSVVGQFVAIDKVLRSGSDATPVPEWLKQIDTPKKVTSIDKKIKSIEVDIEKLKKQKEKEVAKKNEILEISHLLYENGKRLETAIEKSLNLLGYTVSNFRDGDLEIDHIITRDGGIRLIGESEGKDSSAIDISKFRQLESNINEDFAREENNMPAKGILFGNGYRLIDPNKRTDQFTAKCLTNAKRLGTALVRTIDLYRVCLHILDNPEDESFKENCRASIENTVGDIVLFPSTQTEGK